MRVLLLAALLVACSASCPNDCNGHGYCNAHSACECYRNWQGPDCSARTCYFSMAFVDTPQGDLNADGRVSKANVYAVTFTSATTVSGATFGSLAAGTFIRIDNVATPCTSGCDTTAAGWGTPNDVNAWAVTAVDAVAYANSDNKYEIVALVTTPNGFAPAIGAMATSSPTGAKIYSADRDLSVASYSKMNINGINDWTVTFAQITAASKPYVYATQFTNKQTWEKYPANHAHAMGASGQKRYYDEAHFYAECSGKGTCNRDTGECECFDGYSGSGCAQLACPNACSGHGVCKRVSEQNSKYRAWDKHKTTSCVCDPGYTNIDCSDRICPSGDDPITRNQKRNVQSFGYFAAPTSGSFALEFKDEFGDYWATKTLNLLSATKTDVENALEALPNSVVQDVEVSEHTVAAAMITNSNTDGKVWTVTFISNSGTPTQVEPLGVRYSAVYNDTGVATHTTTKGKFTSLIVCASNGDTNCLQSGSGEVTTGASGLHHWYDTTAAAFATSTDEWSVVVDANAPTLFWAQQQAGTTENSLCSSRGLCDYSTGLCKCFNGFTDDDCSRQNALAMY